MSKYNKKLKKSTQIISITKREMGMFTMTIVHLKSKKNSTMSHSFTITGTLQHLHELWTLMRQRVKKGIFTTTSQKKTNSTTWTGRTSRDLALTTTIPRSIIETCQYSKQIETSPRKHLIKQRIESRNKTNRGQLGHSQNLIN